MLKTLSFLVGASALAFVGMATVPQTASAGVGVDGAGAFLCFLPFKVARNPAIHRL